jgi:hypothetical protein
MSCKSAGAAVPALATRAGVPGGRIAPRVGTKITGRGEDSGRLRLFRTASGEQAWAGLALRPQRGLGVPRRGCRAGRVAFSGQVAAGQGAPRRPADRCPAARVRGKLPGSVASERARLPGDREPRVRSARALAAGREGGLEPRPLA